MGDFTRKFFLDPEITIKEEPFHESIINTSASVPIPTRRILEMSDYRDFGLDFDNSQSPLCQDITALQADGYDTSAVWGTNRLNLAENESLKTEALIHMDDDDIFQVDKADLIQGPTLAELNANDETLLGDLNFDDLLLPEEGSSYMPQKPMALHNSNHLNNNSQVLTTSSSCPQSGTLFYLDLPSNYPTPTTSNTSSPLLQSSPLHMGSVQQKHSTLQELLLKRESYGGASSPDRVPAQIPPKTPSTSPSVRMQRSHLSRLSSSAPTHLGLAELWQRREPRTHLLSTGSMAEAGSTSSISTGIMSPEGHEFSHDEFESDDESDGDNHYEDVSSEDSDYEEHGTSKHASKKERYFWQYNVQAKGPKGQRLVMKSKMEDPHVLHEITDPVFSADCSVRGIKHSGKARKGDGNDLTPNARKLFNIGKELDKLGRIINDMTPVSELPVNVRPTSRKEKNKLASRACRLKKKAQHEANKLKLNGLEVEHRNLLNGIALSKDIVIAKLQELNQQNQDELSSRMDVLVKSATRIKVAGLTTEYVNKILDRLKKGQPLNLQEDP